MASTSAVNGTNSTNVADGTKPKPTKFNWEMVEMDVGGTIFCKFCKSSHLEAESAKAHVIRLHLVPERFQCKICKKIIKHRVDFRNHIIRKHKLKGVKNVLKNFSIELSPSKPQAAEPKRQYTKIPNFKEGCPYCAKKLGSYKTHRDHVRICKNKPK